jgi:hypothetical protein
MMKTFFAPNLLEDLSCWHVPSLPSGMDMKKFWAYRAALVRRGFRNSASFLAVRAAVNGHDDAANTAALAVLDALHDAENSLEKKKVFDTKAKF